MLVTMNPVPHGRGTTYRWADCDLCGRRKVCRQQETFHGSTQMLCADCDLAAYNEIKITPAP